MAAHMHEVYDMDPHTKVVWLTEYRIIESLFPMRVVPREGCVLVRVTCVDVSCGW